jgi:hypothetical protein
MQANRRKFALTLLAAPLLPAGCAFRPLPALRTQPAPAPTGPVLIRPPAVGQRWTYRQYNGFNSALLSTETDEIVAVQPRVVIQRRSDAAGSAVREEHQQPGGGMLRDLAWDLVQNYETPLPLWPADLRPGARSVYHGHYRIDGFSSRYWISAHTQVHGWEQVTLPGGAQRALRIEHFIRLEHHDFSRIETTRRDTLWLAPEIGRWVARETTGEYLLPSDPGAFRGDEPHHRWELASWT